VEVSRRKKSAIYRDIQLLAMMVNAQFVFVPWQRETMRGLFQAAAMYFIEHVLTYGYCAKRIVPCATQMCVFPSKRGSVALL
jgi:hypothetical protein